MNTPFWITVVGIGTKLILLFLFILSLFSIAVILDRKKAFKMNQLPNELEDLLKKIRSETGDMTTASTLLSRCLQQLSQSKKNHQSEEALLYSFRSFINREKQNLSKGLPLLATLSSNAPFIGLLGTVLGIIQSFGTLASGNGDMNQVIYNLAEALTTTAVGLFVAIPASIFYNLYSQKLKTLFSEAESLKDSYLSIHLTQLEKKN